MAFVKQFQRRAIEKLASYGGALPWQLEHKRLVTDTGRRLYVYGVSQGFGTCSDIWGMDVLVVGFKRPAMQLVIGVKPVALAYCVLLDAATPAERLQQSWCSSEQYLASVELMTIASCSKDAAVLRQSGKKAFYVACV